MSTDIQSYYRHVRAIFQEQGNPMIAEGQIRYMRNQFDYFGLKAPHWVALAKTIHAERGLSLSQAELTELARLCFEDEHREMHYFALQTIEKAQKKQGPELITLLEELIQTRSWWDTVDWIAKLAGIHFRHYPDQILPVTRRWMDSGHLWLQRVAIIFQLSYREKTDADLMFGYILRVAHSREFFLQKAAGWALRQYSATNPEAVRNFIGAHNLPALTRREGLRKMNVEL